MDEEADPQLADEEGDTEQSSPGSGPVNRYFSVKVTPPAFVPVLPLEASNASRGSAYSYLRMGEPNAGIESRLPSEPKAPKPGQGGPPPWGEGVVLYTTGEYQQNTRSVTESTTKKLEILQDGQKLTSAAYATGVDGLKITYQRGLQVTATAGVVVSQTLGAQYNFWNGNWVNLTSGMSLAGTFGFQITLSPLQSIALAPGFTRLGGLASLEATKQHFIAAHGPVRLSSDPANARAAEEMDGWFKRAKKALAVATAASATAVTSTAILAGPVAAAGSELTWIASGESSDNLEKAMKVTGIATAAAGALLTVIEAGIVLAAGIMRYKTAPEIIAKDLERDESAILKLDGRTKASDAYLKAGSRWLLFGADEKIRVMNGKAGPEISVGTDSITLSAGGNAITLNDGGITITGPQINCVGGEAGTLMLDQTGALISGSSVRANPDAPAAEAEASAVAARNAAERLAAEAEDAGLGPGEVLQYFAALARQEESK